LNEIIQTEGNETTLVYYFFKAADFVGESYIGLRFALCLNKFFSPDKSGALIRVSTPVNAGDFDAASRELKNFIEELYPILIEKL
jgi:EpsI family protein